MVGDPFARTFCVPPPGAAATPCAPTIATLACILTKPGITGLAGGLA